MEIYPEDLGRRQCQEVLRHRPFYGSMEGVEEWAAPFGQVQTKPVSASVLFYFFWSLVIGAVLSGLFAIALWPAFLLGAVFTFIWRQAAGHGPQATSKWWMQNVPAALVALWHQTVGGISRTPATLGQQSEETENSSYSRLTEREITLLQTNLRQKGCDDSLMGAYLELIAAALNLPPFETGRSETERNVREAVRALGGAIETLPPRTVDGIPDSLAQLQRAAARLASDAPLEADPVIAASLHRRAEALQGQIETVARVKVILRRNQALRDELSDQIDALRTSLAAASLGREGGGPKLALLAASIRRVASEADAVTAARVEVDTILSQPHTGVLTVPEEARQQIWLGKGEEL